MRLAWNALLVFSLMSVVPSFAQSDDHIVFNVYRAVDLGDGAIPPKDYFVNMGRKHGLRAGDKMEVYRRISMTDSYNRTHTGEMVVPIATLKLIHVEGSSAIARLDKMLPADEAPSDAALGVRVGDLVNPLR